VTERVFWSAAEARCDWWEAQDRLAAHSVSYGWEHSPEIRARLERASIGADSVRSVADLASIPTLAKDDLPDLQAADPPFGGMLAVPLAELRRVYRSPGGITDPEGREEDFWRMAPPLWAAGFRPGQVALNTLSYHLTPGGHMLDAGLRAVGCVVVPGGVGNSADQVELAFHAGATGYTGTPQFLETLVERALESRGGHPFERALVTGGPLFPKARARLQDEQGIDVYQAYGTADAGVLGYECEVKDGWHVSPRVVIEILTPGTGEPTGPGGAGEVVVTSSNFAYPLLRFRTGDLSALDVEPCTCGRTTPRLAGFLGRVGEGVKVRGMFVHPRQLAALRTDPTVARYQGIVTSDERDDVLTISIEAADGSLIDVDRMTETLSRSAGVRLTVETVAAGVIEDDAPPLVDARSHGAPA
jgi:phenylacetate-CoA ligase